MLLLNKWVYHTDTFIDPYLNIYCRDGPICRNFLLVRFLRAETYIVLLIAEIKTKVPLIIWRSEAKHVVSPTSSHSAVANRGSGHSNSTSSAGPQLQCRIQKRFLRCPMGTPISVTPLGAVALLLRPDQAGRPATADQLARCLRIHFNV